VAAVPIASQTKKKKVSHSYRTTGKMMVFYILIFIFLDGRSEGRTFGLNGNKDYQNELEGCFSI
jgi:hypothetical protein